MAVTGTTTIGSRRERDRRDTASMSARRLPIAMGAVCALIAASIVGACTNSMAPRIPSESAPATQVLAVPPVSAPTPPSPDEIFTDLRQWDAATAQARRAAAEVVARRVPEFALLRLESFACGGQQHEVALYTFERTRSEFVLVPAGTFTMGSPPGEPGREEDETQHSVTLTRPFLMSRTLVTQETWKRVMKRRAWSIDDVRLPAQVSFPDAEAFCAKSNLALPTEAQAEWACRAGSASAWFCGDDERGLDEYLWHDSFSRVPGPISDADETIRPVAQKKPNPFGLFDITGDLPQWGADFYGAYPAGNAIDPRGPEAGDRRVTRGGGCWMRRIDQRSAFRGWSFPDKDGGRYGVRPVKIVPP